MDLTVPLSPYNGTENTFKTGVFTSQSEQTCSSRVFDVRASGNHPFLSQDDPNRYLLPQNHPYISYYNFPANSQYSGQQSIDTVYAMGNWEALSWLRLVGGVRLESTDITVDTVNLTKANERFHSNIEQVDLLPALSGTISLRTNLQLRAAWSQTVVRPTYREISRAELYDVALGRTIRGNPDLTMSSSENYDLRLEWFPRAGELVSIGYFMKKIAKPIEQAAEDVNNELIFYNNYETADVWGVELELRKNLGSLLRTQDQVSLGFNYALIHPRCLSRRLSAATGTISSTSAPRVRATISRNTSSTVVLVGYGTPDEFEEPAPQLEFSISQKLGRHWKAKFSAQNLLDPVYAVSQAWSQGARTIKRYTRGMTFGLSLGCDF